MSDRHDPEINGRHESKQMQPSQVRAAQELVLDLQNTILKKFKNNEWGEINVKIIFNEGKIKSFVVLDENSKLVKV